MILNTTPANFSGWLEKHAARQDPSAANGLRVRFHARLIGQRSQPSKVVIDAVASVQEIVGQEGFKIKCGWPFEVGYFDILPLSAEIIEVVAECRQDIAGDFFSETHAEIVKRWPEASNGSRTTAQIMPHPLKLRREMVKRLKLEGRSRKEIAQEVQESQDVVKKDLEWLRAKGFLPKN